MAFWNELVLTFIPIFVAIDILGVVPLYLGMVAELDPDRCREIARKATLSALAVALGFVLLGEAVFDVMGITLDDFRIAGGILLFILATAELVGADSGRRTDADNVGIFPIGVPLIIGPSALATLLMQNEAHGLGLTTLALVANLVIVYLVLRYAKMIDRFMGKSGAQAFAKVANLLLASIGVMLVRRGIEGFLAR